MKDANLQQALIEAAMAAHHKAYAPYSNFLVGASVLAENSTIITGANVENASYGLTICAERVAASSAAAAGARTLSAVAVAARGGVVPCGACLQFLAEFGNKMDVLLVDADEPANLQTTTLDRLLPKQFKLE